MNELLKTSVLYQYLAQQFQVSELIQLSETGLNHALSNDFDPHAPLGLLDGLAGDGLFLLTLHNQCSYDWMTVVPIYMLCGYQFSASSFLQKTILK